MITNLELVLCSSNYTRIDEPSSTSAQRQIAEDILPNTTDNKLKALKSAVRIERRIKKIA